MNVTLSHVSLCYEKVYDNQVLLQVWTRYFIVGHIAGNEVYLLRIPDIFVNITSSLISTLNPHIIVTLKQKQKIYMNI
jgi:hypothetical protein